MGCGSFCACFGAGLWVGIAERNKKLQLGGGGSPSRDGRLMDGFVGHDMPENNLGKKDKTIRIDWFSGEKRFHLQQSRLEETYRLTISTTHLGSS